MSEILVRVYLAKQRFIQSVHLDFTNYNHDQIAIRAFERNALGSLVVK